MTIALLTLSTTTDTGTATSFENAKGVRVHVFSAATSSATVLIRGSVDGTHWVTLATIVNPTSTGECYKGTKWNWIDAKVSSYSSGTLSAVAESLESDPGAWEIDPRPAVSAGALTVTNLTDSGLTVTRVPYAGTAGLLKDNAALTFTEGTGALGATSFVGAFNGTSVTASALSSGRVPIVGSAGLLADDATFLFNTTSKALSATIHKGASQDTIAAKLIDGAIASAPGTIVITKGSALGSSVLATPTVTDHDGYVLRVVSATAYAHVFTFASGKVNGGALTTATFGGAIGDGITLIAYGGTWYTLASRNVTLS